MLCLGKTFLRNVAEREIIRLEYENLETDLKTKRIYLLHCLLYVDKDPFHGTKGL